MLSNSERQRIFQFRKKHDLTPIDVKKKDKKAVLNMYLMMKKGELPKELVAYLKQQRG